MNERSFREEEKVVDGTVRDAIMAAALETFSENGFHGASMRQLAVRANVSLSNVYNYFPGKSDILLGILRDGSMSQMNSTLAAVEAAGPKVVDRFVAAVVAFVRFDLENLEVCFVANSELRYLDRDQRAEVVRLRDGLQKIFEDLIAEGIEEGVFKTGSPREAVRAMLTMCAGVTVWYHPGGPMTAEDVAQLYARFALLLVEGP